MTGIPVKQLKDKDGNAIQPNSPDKVGYYKPGGSGLEWGVEHTITADGWVKVTGNYGDGLSNIIQLKVNEIVMIQYQIGDGVGDALAITCIPVKKDDKVIATGGKMSQFLVFYPNRTNLENGGGEFDTLNILLASDLQGAVI